MTISDDMDKYIELHQHSAHSWWVSYVDNGMRHDVSMDLYEAEAVQSAQVRKRISGQEIRISKNVGYPLFYRGPFAPHRFGERI